MAGTGNFTPAQAVGTFTGEGVDLNSFNHLTQVIWKSTTQLGCGAAICKIPVGGREVFATYYVCLYDPVGNIVGEEKFNVQ